MERGRLSEEGAAAYICRSCLARMVNRASRQSKKGGRMEVDKTAPPAASPWPCPGLTCLDRRRLAETADRTSQVAPFGILAGRKR